MYYQHPHPYYVNMPRCCCGYQPMYQTPNQIWNQPDWNATHNEHNMALKDFGKRPFVINIEEATKQNETFRTAIWTGDHLQVTLMNIRPGEDIGLEMHPNVDQFLRLEAGQGLVQMGNAQNNLTFEKNVYDDDAIMIPAGTWHNLTNTGNEPLKLYSIYGPPNHPFGTVHKTKADAIAAENHY